MICFSKASPNRLKQGGLERDSLLSSVINESRSFFIYSNAIKLLSSKLVLVDCISLKDCADSV